MWYAVLRKEITHTIYNVQLVLRAGSVWTCKKVEFGMVQFDNAENPGDKLFLTPHEARTLFTKPTKSETSAYEEAIMVCEASYC